MKKMYFLTTNAEKVEAELVYRNYRAESSKHNGADSIRYKIGSGQWTECSLRCFNELAIRKGWIETTEAKLKVLGL